MRQKRSSLETLNKQIRHALNQVLSNADADSLVIERIVLPRQRERVIGAPKRKQKKSDKSWWCNNNIEDEFHPGWNAEVIDLTTHQKSTGGG